MVMKSSITKNIVSNIVKDAFGWKDGKPKKWAVVLANVVTEEPYVHHCE